MVTKWGFNDSVGRLVVNVENQYGMKSAGSDEQSRNIDMEIRKLSDDTYNMAMDCLMENRDKLDLMTKALIKFETIDANQVARIMEGEDLAPDVVLGVSEE
jgi:cell division protease FtsH